MEKLSGQDKEQRLYRSHLSLVVKWDMSFYYLGPAGLGPDGTHGAVPGCESALHPALQGFWAWSGRHDWRSPWYHGLRRRGRRRRRAARLGEVWIPVGLPGRGGRGHCPRDHPSQLGILRGPAEGHRATDRPMYQLSLTTSTSIRDGRHQRGPGPSAGEEQQGRGGHDVPTSAEERKVRGETSGAALEARLSDGLDDALDL